MNTLPVTAPRIDIANPLDVLGWAERFDVSADVLREVMVQVGDDAEAVALVLKGSVTACRPH